MQVDITAVYTEIARPSGIISSQGTEGYCCQSPSVYNLCRFAFCYLNFLCTFSSKISSDSTLSLTFRQEFICFGLEYNAHSTLITNT